MKRLRWAILVAAAVPPSTALAQSNWITTFDLGAGGRLGTVPNAFTAAGSDWSGYVTSGKRINGGLFLTGSLGMMLQDFEMVTVDSSAGGTSTFHSYVLSFGPTLVAKPWEGFLAIMSAQPAAVVSLWGLGSFDNCTLQCFNPQVVPHSHQAELHPAAMLSFMMAYQMVGPENGARPWALGIQVRGLIAPAHGASGIPVSQLGISLGFVAGAP